MPVLADFLYPDGAEFALQRQQIPAFAIGWQPGSFALESGRLTRLQEVVYGGYQVVVEFKSWIWDWDNRGFMLNEMFENFYAIPPGGGAPISTGTTLILWSWDTTFNTPIIEIVFPAAVNYYYFQRMPPATRPYWCPMPDHLPATPFWIS